MLDCNKLCRACLTSIETVQYYLFDNVSSDLYHFCTSIEVKQEDPLSNAICNTCYDQLRKFCHFKNTCIQSHKILLNCKSIKSDEICLENLKNEDFINKCIVQTFPENHKREPNEDVQTENLKLDLAENIIGNDDIEVRDDYVVDKKSNSDTTVLVKGTSKTKTKKRSNLKLINSMKNLVCEVCHRRFSSSEKLKTHKLSHEIGPARGKVQQENRERQCTCEYCGKMFFTKTTLNKHVSRCHTGRRFLCPICSYAFNDKCNLSRHLLIHEGKKLHKCDICEKAFASRFSFDEHQRIHTGERPFSCSYCQKSFLSKSRLVLHHRTHTGEKPHKCDICARGFTQRGALNRHLKIHNKIPSSTKGKYKETWV